MTTEDTDCSVQDIYSSVEGIFIELDTLRLTAKNSYHLLCLNEDEVELLNELISSYEQGMLICQKYFYGILNLEEFCEELINAELKRFLVDKMNGFLSEEVIQKYHLEEGDGCEGKHHCKETITEN